MGISIMQTFRNSVRFCLKTSPISLCTSKEISSFFEMDIMEYNKKLLNEVVKHNKVFINATIYENSFSNDLTFRLDGVREEVYINRFKEVFAKELILLALSN